MTEFCYTFTSTCVFSFEITTFLSALCRPTSQHEAYLLCKDEKPKLRHCNTHWNCFLSLIYMILEPYAHKLPSLKLPADYGY